MGTALLVGLAVVAGCGTRAESATTGTAESDTGEAQLELEGRMSPVVRITPIIDQVKDMYHVKRADKPPVIDGKTDEWRDVPAMVLETKNHFLGTSWDGPRDLNGSLRLLWDGKALYFCLSVTDDVHHAPDAGGRSGQNDCCQFAFDAYMNGPPGYDRDELLFCVSDSPAGPRVVQNREWGSPEDKEILVPEQTIAMSSRGEHTRLYEWAMPWESLRPVSPWLLGRCGFSFAIIDKDEKDTEGALHWARGIFWGRDASRFGQIVFDGARGSRSAGMILGPVREPAPELTVYEPDDWLRGAGTKAAATARLIVYAAKDMKTAPEIRVFRAGEDDPDNIGRAEATLASGQTVFFTWDLSHLRPGDYELTCRAPSVFEQPTPRLAFTRRPVNFEIFKTVDGVELKLFVFQPRDHRPAEKRPAVVFFHGGGFRAGTPGQFKNQCLYLASRGIVGITAQYRLTSRPGVKVPHCIADAKSAMRWVRANAKKLGIDPERIVAGGGSAGGLSAACIGVVPGLDEPGGDTSISTLPCAMVLFNPGVVTAPIDEEAEADEEEMAKSREWFGMDPRALSPYHHIRKGLPPMIMFFGSDDGGLEQAALFRDAYVAKGNVCEMKTWPGQRHGFFNYRSKNKKHFIETCREMDRFLVSLGLLQGDPTIEQFAAGLD